MSVFRPLHPPLGSGKNTDYDLTEDQEEKRQKALAHFSDAEYKLLGEEKGTLSEEERFWLSNECILRYLRAAKWALPTAIQRLEETLKWRREFGMYDLITADYVEPEGVTGKEIIFGYDVSGRPALYLVPSRQNTTDPSRQLKYTVWMLERCIDLMPPGVESLDLLINFADRAKNPSIGTSRAMLNILQNHYPERLGLSLIINVPMLVYGFFKIIMPFVDPITRSKIKFNPVIFEEGYMTKDMVMKEWWGGDHDFVYDHAQYWPALVKMCQERREAHFQRWLDLGGTVGISEWEVTGGAREEISEVVEKVAADVAECAPGVAV